MATVIKGCAALTAALALASCGQPEPILILPPAALATCADEPAPPVLPPRDGTDATQLERDKRMLDGYLTLRTAYGSCKSKVEGLARWREAAQD